VPAPHHEIRGRTRRRDQLIEHRRVHRRGVGDHLGGSHLQRGHRPAEEPSRRHGIAAGGHEHVDDLAVLVDGVVHVPADTPLTLTEVASVNHLPPGACRQNLAASASSSVQRCTHRKAGDMVDLDTTLDQQFLDVAVRQVVPQVEPDGDHDDVGWEPEPGERRPWWLHGRRRFEYFTRSSLPDQSIDRCNGPGGGTAGCR
jgi:hypothetical protein